MRVYVLSVYSNMTSELDSRIEHATNVYEAFKKSDLTKDWVEGLMDSYILDAEILDDDEIIEHLKQYMFDNDMAFNAIRID